jgi:hypothetical protein
MAAHLLPSQLHDTVDVFKASLPERMGQMTTAGTFLFFRFYLFQDFRFSAICDNVSFDIGIRVAETVTDLFHRLF